MKLQIEHICPHCGKSAKQEVTITKSQAAGIMSKGRKLPSKEQLSEWGKKGAKIKYAKTHQPK